MNEKGVIITFLGERKNLRGRYRNGGFISTPKGYFLFLNKKWYKQVLDKEKSFFSVRTGAAIREYKWEEIKSRN